MAPTASAEETHYYFTKPDPCNVGLRAERSVRDCPCLVIFIAAWVLFLALLGCAFHNGDHNRLFFGTDYLGNVCGMGTPQGVDSQVQQDWSARTLVWYPVGFSLSGSLEFTNAFRLGQCVSACPLAGQTMSNAYGSSSWTSKTYVFFNSTVAFNRCVPDLRSLHCDAQPGCNTNAVNGEQGDANSGALGNSQTMLSQGFALLYKYAWLIPVTLILTAAFCVLWLSVLKHFLRPVVYITMAVCVTALLLLGAFFIHQATVVGKAASAYDAYMAIGALILIGTFLLICALLYLRKDVDVACDIIGEAGNVLKAIPTTMLVPVVTSLVVMLVTVIFSFVAVFIHTAQTGQMVNVLPPAGSGSSNATQAVTVFVNDTWQSYGQWYNLFMFLWTVGFVHAISFMTLSFCGVFWYWSQPGSQKSTDAGVFQGLKLTFSYHLGTLAFGSLILAIVQFARVLLSVLENRLRKVSENASAVRFLLCCAQCLLACFERAVKFLNKNAYIVASMTGEGLITAARHAVSLLLPRAGTVGAVNVVGEFVLGLGKILIVAGVTIIGYLILKHADGDESLTGSGLIVVLFVVAMLAYFVTSVFINVFAVSIDTLLLSYCYDLEVNNGADRPFYFPESLAHHVQSAKANLQQHQGPSSPGSGAYQTLKS